MPGPAELSDIIDQLRLPKVKSSCCGCSLQLATKIIAIIHIVLIGGLFLLIFGFSIYHEYKYHLEYEYKTGFTNAFMRDEFTLSLVISVVTYSGILYIGVSKNSTDYFVPWFVMKWFMLAVNALHLLETVYYRIALEYKSMEVFVHLAYMGLDFYMIVIVSSYYKELKEREKEDYQ